MEGRGTIIILITQKFGMHIILTKEERVRINNY